MDEPVVQTGELICDDRSVRLLMRVKQLSGTATQCPDRRLCFLAISRRSGGRAWAGKNRRRARDTHEAHAELVAWCVGQQIEQDPIG